MKKSITTACACLFAGFIIAQPSTWTWAKNGIGSQADYGNSITTDINNNVYTIGGFQSPTIVFGTYTLTSANLNTIVPENDIYLLKQDMAGNVLWAISAGGTSGDIGYAVDTDMNGNVYIAGSSSSSVLTIGTVTINKNHSEDFWVAKLDNAGNVIWAKSFFGDQQDVAKGIAVDQNGNVIVVGFSGSNNLVIGTNTITNVAGDFAFIAKFDTNGNVMWVRHAAGDGSEQARDVDIDPNYNDIFVTGFYNSSTLTFGNHTITNTKVTNAPLANSQAYDVFVVKYDANGVANWVRTAGGREDEFGLSISVAPTTNLYIAGYVYIGGEYTSPTFTVGNGISINNTGTSGQFEDVFLLKYDASNGDPMWASTIGGTNRDYFGGVTAVRNAGVVMSGSFKSASLNSGTVSATKIGATDNYDIFVSAFASSGEAVMIKTAGGTSDERSLDVIIDNMYNVYATGYYYSMPASFDAIQLMNSGNGDMFTAQLSVPDLAKLILAGVSEEDKNSWTLAPNPTNRFVNLIPAKQLNDVKIQVSNILGQNVLEEELTNPGNISVDLGSLPVGIYNISIKSANTVMTYKVIKN
jgi:hypothetical protein